MDLERNSTCALPDSSVANYPALADDPTLRERLNATFARTKELGFKRDALVVDFLYMEARDPGFCNASSVAAWLNKPGVPAEQRFEMLLQVTQKKQQEMKENH
ncbi:hypothetical protein [Burkholderia ubonensis]|uniref:hypothetical protein n=1 Tax=Burkholderia ubonensis TaxID=101571 RepID=UPI000ADFA3C5|nr:hypothetical protein [Burkholderia ubonensis]